MHARDLTPRVRVVLTAAAIGVIVGAAGLFAYLETMAHVRYVKDNQQPSFHSIYQFREHQLRLIRALNEYAYQPEKIDHDELMQRFDVLWSRVGPIVSQETAALLGEPEDYQLQLARIRDVLERVDPLVQNLRPGDRETTASIIAQVEEMYEPYEALRRNMQSNADLRSHDLVSEARRYGYIQIALLSISLITGGSLLFLVIRHANRAHLLASRDPLTGLLNRSQLGAALTGSESKSPGEPRMVALHCIDLDRFKSINDTLGHPVGDKLLVEVGRRLAKCIRSGDTIIRLGGDEFAIVQPDLTRMEDAEMLARRLVQVGAEPFLIDGHTLTTGFSVGCAVYPRDDEDVRGLVEKADLALYEAKRLGRRTFSFFERSMEDHAIRQRHLEGELRKALVSNQLEVHFQPKYRLSDGQLTGAEALVRWLHPDVGAISPADFVPVAEECGLIGAIGEMVLHRACTAAAGWRALTAQPLHVSVNLSAAQFEQQDIVALTQKALDASGLDARLLEFEVTEGLLLKDSDDIKRQIDALKSLGVSLSLDDFGTGYSSISYLRQFSFDRIKIDRSFVEGLGVSAEARPVIEAIIRLAHGIGMHVVAEGVESRQQLYDLRRMGCDEAQGFHLGRPLQADRFREHIAAAPLLAMAPEVQENLPRLSFARP
ncbi:MAG: EAL domain-containing protein [Alphaproteobacteria bacterium]